MRPSDAPYIGPAPFGTDDRMRFFGRERESGELASLVLAHPITLLVASSGAGKTSLVNAGLIPRLTGVDDGIPRCEVLPVVLFRQMAASDTLETAVDNRFIAYALAAISPGNETLPEGTPGSLASALKERPLVTDRFGQPLPRVLIFDQFEELFTIHPQLWEDRRPFLEELLTIADADPMTRILLSMREEYLARLEQLGGMRSTDTLRFRLHLERLDRDKALQAVNGPLPHSVSFAPDVADTLVDELRRESSGTAINGAAGETFLGRYVEPVQLQVVCRALWNCLPEGTAVISEEIRQECGSVDRALEAFYGTVVEEATTAELSTNEGMVRHWIENELISSRMTRNTVPLDDAEASGISAIVLDRLVDQHLLRKEERFNIPWYELTHDRLIAPVTSSNAHWFAENPDPLYAVQQQTRQWLREERQAGYLLTGEPLFEAADLARVHPELLSREELEFVRASEDLQRNYDEGEKSRRRSRLIALACAAAAATMLLLSLYALRLKQDADEQRAEAVRQQQITLSQTVASQALLASRRGEDDLGALLARQAYLFDTDGAVGGSTGTALQSTIGSPYFSKRMKTGQQWISALAFSPGEGSYLASAGGVSGDSSVALWRLSEGEFRADKMLIDPVLGSRAHSSGATSLAFSPDGAMLLTGGGDGLVKIWDVESGGLVDTLPGPGGAIRALSSGFDADGAPIVVAASCRADMQSLNAARAAPACDPQSATVRVWDLGSTGEPQDIDAAGMVRLDTIALSRSGLWLATGGCLQYLEESTFCESGLGLLWNLADLSAPPVRLQGHTGTVSAAIFVEREGEPVRLVTAGEDRLLRSWNVEAPSDPQLLIGHRGPLLSLAYSPVLNTLVAGDQEAIVGLWSLSEPVPVVSVLGSATEWVRSLAFSPSGTLLATTAGSGEIRFWNLGPRSTPPAVLSGHDDYVRALDFADIDGAPLLASAGEDGRVRLWTFADDGVQEEVLVPRDDGASFKLSSVAWDRAGERLLTGAEDGIARISVRDENGNWVTRPVNVIPFRTGAVYVEFAPDDSLIFTGDASGQVRIWSLLGGEPRGETLPGEDAKSPVQVIVLNDEGTRLAAGYRDGTIRIWRLFDGGLRAELVHTLLQESDIKALAFGPGDYLAAGGAPGTHDVTTRIWDIENGEVVVALPGIQGEIRSLSFSPDGSQLATGSKDQSVLIWDTTDWQAQPIRIGVPEWVRALVYAPDGSMIAVPTKRGGIQTINPNLESLSIAVCENVAENLSRNQWSGLISLDDQIGYQKTCDALEEPDETDPADLED